MRLWASALLGLSVFLVSCAGKIEGQVFLDANANAVADPNEKTLTRVTVKASHNNEFIGRTKTDAKGRFSLKSRESGYYCVEIEEPGLQQNLMHQLSTGQLPQGAVPSVDANIGFGPPMAPSVKKQIAGSTPASPAPSPAPAGQPAAGSQPNSAGQPAQGGTEQKKPEEKKPEPKQAQPERRSSGVVCENVASFGFHVDIPVMLDYSADLARIPAPMKQTREAGEDFRLHIAVPGGCVLKPLYVPDALLVFWPREEAQRDPAILTIDPRVGRVDFRDNVFASSVTLDLRVREDLPLGDLSVQMIPEVLCPDGQEFALSSVEIDLKAAPKLVIWQEIAAQGRSGGDIPWEIVLENPTDREYTVTVTAQPPPPELVQIGAIEGLRCHALGDKIECPALTLAPHSNLRDNPLRFSVRLLEAARETPVTFSAQAKVHDFEGEPVPATDARVVIQPGE